MGPKERLAVDHVIKQENGKAGKPDQGRFPLARALLSAGLIAGLIYMVDLEKIWASFQTMALLPFLAACFIFAITQILTAWRWQIVLKSLRDDTPGLWFVNGLSMIGLFFNFFLPSTVAPVGPAADGLPVGVQIVGPEYADRTTIDFAAKLGEVIGGYTPPPGYD